MSMFKKAAYISVVFIIILCAAFLFIKKPKQNSDLSDTAQLILSGKVDIACEDAKWLYLMMKEMEEQKNAQLVSLGDNASPSEFEKEFMSNNTPSQAAINAWHDELVTATNNKYIREPEKYHKIMDVIGEGMVEIYYTTYLVQSGEASETDVLAAINERFCAQTEVK